MDQLVQKIMRATRAHGGPVPQADDITIVLVHRQA
jgi:serine phosphatase RsbU (regulator of sigma subunit)